jgi:hypothetical protein
MPSIVNQSRAAVEAEMQKAAQQAGMSIDAPNAVAAHSVHAEAVNSAIVVQDDSPAALSKGINLLLVHLILPKGATEQHSKVAIPDGFYVVKLTVDEAKLTGHAELLSLAGTPVATLSTLVELAPQPKTPHPVQHAALPVSAGISFCGLTVDARIRGIVITVSVRWC